MERESTEEQITQKQEKKDRKKRSSDERPT